MSIFNEIESLWDSITKLFKKAKDDLAKATVFIVNNIQPVLFSQTAHTLASILDAVVSSQLPTEILDEVKKWLPVFLTAEGIVTTLTPDSTEDEVKAALDKFLQLFPNLTAAQRAQYWTTLAAQVYALIHELSTGEKITFGEAARIVETAYEAYIQTKNS